MTRRVDPRTVAGLLGRVVKYLSVPLLVPLVTAIRYGESPLPFLVTMVVTLGLGLALERLDPNPTLGTADGFVFVGATWLLVPLLGTIPYLVAGNGTVAMPANALFE